LKKKKSMHKRHALKEVLKEQGRRFSGGKSLVLKVKKSSRKPDRDGVEKRGQGNEKSPPTGRTDEGLEKKLHYPDLGHRCIEGKRGLVGAPVGVFYYEARRTLEG